MTEHEYIPQPSPHDPPQSDFLWTIGQIESTLATLLRLLSAENVSAIDRFIASLFTEIVFAIDRFLASLTTQGDDQ